MKKRRPTSEQALIEDIVGLAYHVSTTTDVDVFVDYYGHTNAICIEIYLDGYNSERRDYRKTINLDTHKDVIGKLSQIRKELIRTLWGTAKEGYDERD